MVRRVISKLAYYFRLIRSGDAGILWSDVRRWVWSEKQEYGLSRDLAVPHTPPPARIPIEVRPLDAELAKLAFNTDGIEAIERRELEARRRLWEEHLGTAYVAVDSGGNPCYIQWAIPGSEADHVDRFFDGAFPHLAPDELLLEAAWALPHARGQRIMSEAMSRITEAASGPEHRRALTFVRVDNEPSLRGCDSAGFHVYTQRAEVWRLGRRRVQWVPTSTPATSASTSGS